MKLIKMSLLSAAVASSIGAMSAPALADDSVSVSGNFGIVSDYRFRGYSQTFGKPAVQGGIDLSLPMGFYLGTWMSNVSGNQYMNGAGLEWDLYGGYTYTVNADLSLDVGGLYYYYPGAYSPDGSGGQTKYNTFEWHVAGTYKWFTLKYSQTTNDWFGVADSKGSGYIELNGSYPVTDKISLNAHVGHQKVKNSSSSDYTDWSLGASYDLKGWGLGLTYVDTNVSKADGTITDVSGMNTKNIAGPTVVLSVSKSF